MARGNLFENWTLEDYVEEYEQLLIDNRKLRKRVAQLEGEESIPDAWWKDCPKLAQKVMERIIEGNDELVKENERLTKREHLLDALEAAGVDNWEGYEEIDYDE